MELSKQKGKGDVYDPYRKVWVASTPEEIVRQKLLHVMTTQLGFPKELLAVETQLSEVPHLKKLENLPKRRADIICYAKGIHPEYSLYPLLVIECKEGQVGDEAREQVLGYNHFIQANFVAIAGENCVELVYPEHLCFLPSYSQLMEYLCK
ncbi:MAG: type I restriction enzyme HsdR N-terminal domain-containing protein [Verrucomicrobia bacterium]|nr:type I restriction enzyme HsdR N-terminal domain-containing protein [Verrucomicrobiota bacterium]